MKLLFWTTLAVLLAGARYHLRHRVCARGGDYVPRHGEARLDELWIQRLAQMAARRRRMGWA